MLGDRPVGDVTARVVVTLTRVGHRVAPGHRIAHSVEHPRDDILSRGVVDRGLRHAHPDGPSETPWYPDRLVKCTCGTRGPSRQGSSPVVRPNRLRGNPRQPRNVTDDMA